MINRFIFAAMLVCVMALIGHTVFAADRVFLAMDSQATNHASGNIGGGRIGPLQAAPTANEQRKLAPTELFAMNRADVRGDIWSILNVTCTLFSSFFGFFILAGLAMVVVGFTKAKNAGHGVAMNMMVFVIAVLGYWICGYAIQMGGASTGGGAETGLLNSEFSFSFFGKQFGIWGSRYFFLSGAAYDISIMALFLSQAVFMTVAATIPTGAMAERWTFKSLLVYGFFISMFVYPSYANWVWGGGWLSQLGSNCGLGHGVVDFSGSSVVHMVGGITGLAGALVLGPRTGKYKANGAPTAIPGHHIPMAVIGCMVLFSGWLGLASSSAFVVAYSRISVIAVNILLASVAAAFSATFYLWFLYGKPDISLSVNGLLGGLVAVSASCAFIRPLGAIIIGLIAGVLCCVSVFIVERKLRVDDPVGAVSVHGVCGAWGLIALGLFADGTFGDGWNGVSGTVKGLFYGGGISQLAAEIVAVVVNFVFIFSVMYLFFKVLSLIMPLRVAEEIEFEGLDQHEVAVTAYPDFSITKTSR